MLVVAVVEIIQILAEMLVLVDLVVEEQDLRGLLESLIKQPMELQD